MALYRVPSLSMLAALRVSTPWLCRVPLLTSAPLKVALMLPLNSRSAVLLNEPAVRPRLPDPSRLPVLVSAPVVVNVSAPLPLWKSVPPVLLKDAALTLAFTLFRPTLPLVLLKPPVLWMLALALPLAHPSADARHMARLFEERLTRLSNGAGGLDTGYGI